MSWEIVEKKEKKQEEFNYVKFNEGTNKLRMIGEPREVWTHWVQSANGGKGLSIVCLGKGKCPMCDKLAYDKANNVKTKDRIQRQFVINVFNRTTNRVELLQKGKNIFESLAVMNREMGDITTYDVNIVKTGQGLETKYQVLPVLNSKDAIPEGLELYNLTDVTKQLSEEVVTLLMNGMTLEEVSKTLNENSEDVDFNN